MCLLRRTCWRVWATDGRRQIFSSLWEPTCSQQENSSIAYVCYLCLHTHTHTHTHRREVDLFTHLLTARRVWTTSLTSESNRHIEFKKSDENIKKKAKQFEIHLTFLFTSLLDTKRQSSIKKHLHFLTEKDLWNHVSSVWCLPTCFLLITDATWSDKQPIREMKSGVRQSDDSRTIKHAKMACSGADKLVNNCRHFCYKNLFQQIS